jgi:hypothetical protein
LERRRFPERSQGLIAFAEAPTGLSDPLPSTTEFIIESETFWRRTGRFLENIPSEFCHLKGQCRVAKSVDKCGEHN